MTGPSRRGDRTMGGDYCTVWDAAGNCVRVYTRDGRRVEPPDALPPPCPVCGRTLEHIIGCPEMDRPR